MRLIKYVGIAACFYLGSMTSAWALECGAFNWPYCSAGDNQFSGGFSPSNTYGGFGGGNCTANKTPVVFIHGNGDTSVNWDAPAVINPAGYPKPPRSVYDEFKARGYNDCELFGINYLSPSDREHPERNYHEKKYQQRIASFIDQVKAYTGKSKVDVVSHSLGVSMAISSFKRYNKWGSVRKFINIGGGIRGLNSCIYVGYANPIYPSCAGQNAYDSYKFGLFPSTGAWLVTWGRNDWTGSTSSRSMRKAPYYNKNVQFYTISAGFHDQIHCTTVFGWNDCRYGSNFNRYSNVKAQLDVGAGDSAWQVDLNFADYSPYNLRGGDRNGIGHFGAKFNTGKIIYTMLNTACTGTACKGDYASGPVVNN